MKKLLSPAPSRQETQWGLRYLAFQIIFLPGLLAYANGYLRLKETELNFVYFLVNFLAILWIFHDFLGESTVSMTRHPIQFLQTVILALAGYQACTAAVNQLILLLVPGYANANDASIAALSRDGFFLMAVGTVVLVPVAEECLYRGILFRKLWEKNKWAGYLVSIAAFSAIHVVGFFGVYTPTELALAMAQYIPAGLCLSWAYNKAGTIFAPIVIHAIVNAIGISNMR